MPTLKVNPDEYIAEMQRRGLVASDSPRRPVTPLAIVQAEPAKTKSTKPKQQRPIGPAVYTFSVFIPGVILKSESNIGGRLRAKISRKLEVKQAVRTYLAGVVIPFTAYPLQVTLTRIANGGRRLDPGNLEIVFKAVQDVVSEHWEFDDGDRSKVKWRFKQRTSWADQAGILVEARG